MGNNNHGQLGINDINVKIKNSPILVEALMDKKPIAISCGSNHTVVCSGKIINLKIKLIRGWRSVCMGLRKIWSFRNYCP